MRRRDFIKGIVGSATAWPLAARAQAARKRPLIGYLETGHKELVKERDAAFIDGMRELGYVEGDSFEVAYRFADNDYSRLPALAAELVQLQPLVIVTAVTTAAVAAAKATRTVPIVSEILNDPIGEGMITSYAHPGGNVTGIMNTIEGLPGKLVEITLEIVPTARRIGFLVNPANLATVAQWQEIETAVKAKGLQVTRQNIRTSDDLSNAFKAFSTSGVDAVIVSRDTVLLTAAGRVAELALAARLPTIAGQSEEVRAGELVSYGTSLIANTRRAAYFVDKILKGDKPADLPVEFPTQVELAINRKTAKALGLALPQALLATADEVIE
jgi:putative tryptophan/tyrosine transport system substrate-binding protein